MSRLSGAHTHHGGGAETAAVLVGVILLAGIVEWILSVSIWIAIALGVLLVIAAAVLVWWLRGKSARQARYDAHYAAAFAPFHEVRKVTATVIPQAVPAAQHPELPAAVPAVESHVHYHLHLADSVAARVFATGYGAGIAGGQADGHAAGYSAGEAGP